MSSRKIEKPEDCIPRDASFLLANRDNNKPIWVFIDEEVGQIIALAMDAVYLDCSSGKDRDFESDFKIVEAWRDLSIRLKREA